MTAFLLTSPWWFLRVSSSNLRSASPFRSVWNSLTNMLLKAICLSLNCAQTPGRFSCTMALPSLLCPVTNVVWPGNDEIWFSLRGTVNMLLSSDMMAVCFSLRLSK